MRHRELKRWLPTAGWIAAAFLLYCLVFTNEYGPFLYLGGFDAIDVACAVLLLAVLDGRWSGRRLFELKPLVAMGTVSYGFYLWHLPVFFAIRYFDTHWNDVVRVIVAFSITMTLTLISWFALERPLMRWGGRLEDKRRLRLVAERAETLHASVATSTPSLPAASTAEDNSNSTVFGSPHQPNSTDASGATDD
jgi:peptidoglycan/LPS O-acetylase OafA/YrhL